MSDISHIERIKLEKLLGMSTGNVLDFINSTFQDFIMDATEKNLYDKAYDADSGSKANRLRKFWLLDD